jgi:hypothetical protein
MTLPNSSDAAFYGGTDNTASRTNASNADLTGQIQLDGTRATSPNTGSRYLNHVGITDSSSTNGKPADCDYITTKFNSHKDATYEVTVRDGKIYINTGNGEQVSQPQLHHPANGAEQQARDNNYYRQPVQPPPEAYPPPQQYAQYPPNEGYYAQPIPIPMPYPMREPYGYHHHEPYGYPPRQPWGYEHHRGGFNLGGLLFGAVEGALTGGRGYYPPPYEGAGYYRPAPIAYMPQTFPVQQASYNYNQPNYASADSGYYGSNYTPSYQRGLNPGYTQTSSYDAYGNINQPNDDSFYYS